MGNNTSRSIQEELDDRFTIVKRLPEDITLRQDKSDKSQYLVRKLVFLKQSEFNQEIKLLDSKKQIQNPHVTQLLKYQTHVEDMICSRHHTIYVLYQHPHRNLDQQISQRFIQRRRFQQKQLWSILASCILGLSTLQKSNIPHESLKSEQILLSTSGTIQVADPYCMDSESNYRRMIQSRAVRNVYLAPELCEALLKEEIEVPKQVDRYKADVWTMGMIVLEMGLLEYQYECYREDFTRVDQGKLAERVEELGKQYSPELKVMVELMLQMNPQDRQLWSQMQQFVKKNQAPTNTTFIQSKIIQDSNDKYNNTASQNTIIQRPEDNNHKNTFTNDFLDDLVPVQMSRAFRPQLQAARGPADNYVTRVELDENMVEMSEEDTNSQEGESGADGIRPVNGVEGAHPGHTAQKEKAMDTTKVEPSKPSSIRQLKPQQTKNSDVEPISHTQQPTSKISNPPDNSRQPLHLQPRNFKPTSTAPSTSITPRHQPEQSIPSSIPPPTNPYSYTPPFYTDLYRPPSSYLPSTSYNFPSFTPYTSSYIPPVSSYVPPITAATSSSSYSSLAWMNKPPAFSMADNRDLFTDYARLGIQRGGATSSSYLPASTVPLSSVPIGSIPPSTYESKYVYQPKPSFTNAPIKHQPAPWQHASTFNYKQVDPNLAPSPIQAMKDKQRNSSPMVGHNETGSISQKDLSFKKEEQTSKKQKQPILPMRKNSNTDRLPGRSDSKSKLLDQEDALHQNNPIFVIEHYKQGSRYEGEKVNGLKHGRGKYFYVDGGLYDGEWVKNKMQGKGKIYYQSGKLAYQGQWEKDMFYGEGTHYNQYPVPIKGSFDYRNFDSLGDYWIKTKGHFKDDFKQGKCTIYLQNGEFFQGNFEEDLATGPGVFHTMDGRKIKGNWNQNRLISENS